MRGSRVITSVTPRTNVKTTFTRELKLDNNQDADQLRLLSIFHFVVAGVVGLFSLFPLIHVAVGIGILSGSFDDANGATPPALLGWLFVLMPMAMIAIGLTLAICIAVAGRRLARRTGYLYCLVIAGIETMLMPFGTALGVLTILVLMRPSVKLLFGIQPDVTSPKAS